MRITIEKYNPEWKDLFQIEKQTLENTLDGVDACIEHIGSTSIEGLGAKPVIDILIGVKDFSIVNVTIHKIESLGYNYISDFEDQMPYRRFFTKVQNGKRTHHVHIVQVNSDFWKRHLLFRDYLRSNSVDRDNYNNLKIELSKREWKDGNEYASAKTEFIKSIEHKISFVPKIKFKMETSEIGFSETLHEDISIISELEKSEENAFFIIPYSVERHHQVIASSDEEHLSIWSKADSKLIGFIILGGLSSNSSLEFRRIVLQNKGKGFGRQSIQLIKEYCFQHLKFHRLWLDVFEGNHRAIHLYKSEGFKMDDESVDEKPGPKLRNLLIYSILENQL